MSAITLDHSSASFIRHDQNVFSKIVQKVIDFVKDIFNKIYALFTSHRILNDNGQFSLWQDTHCAEVIEIYESNPNANTEKAVAWIKKYKRQMHGYPGETSFTTIDMEAFKASRLGQRFVENKKGMIKLLTHEYEIPQEFINERTQKILIKVNVLFKELADLYEKKLTEMLEEKLKSGSCYGQVFTLSKHLITHGGAIAKLKKEDLDKIEQIFFQINQIAFDTAKISSAKDVMDKIWPVVCNIIIQEREKRSLKQKFLHRDELDPRQMEFNFNAKGDEISSKLHKSIFSEFPQPMQSEKIKAPEDACLEDQQFRDFILQSVDNAQGSVAYHIGVEGHAMLLHCHDQSKVYELYDPYWIGCVSFATKEEMIQAMIELSETKKSKIQAVHRFYQAK